MTIIDALTVQSRMLCVASSRVLVAVAGIFAANVALAVPTVSEYTVSWPDDGWYQVQNAETFATICEGGLSCTVSAGTYHVINHTTGQRFESVIVTDTQIGVLVNGSRISWPDDGWYQVQNARSYSSVCEGGRYCDVADGQYNVINLSTGQRYQGILVGSVAAIPLPSPNPSDPFGTLLEIDNEPTVTGGPPTQPKNLRLDLVSNDWAEFSWAPAYDDGHVVQYNIYRSDGVTYIVKANQTHSAPGLQPELDKYWNTTSFIDCNYTRFFHLLHNCSANKPSPGQTYSYAVTAVDDLGQESAASEPLSITYIANRDAPVPSYRDFYKPVKDTFVQDNNLSVVDSWRGKFDLVFSDEFNGNAIDASKWQTHLTWGDSRIINGEQQYFVNTQANPDFGYNPFSFTGESMVINAIPIPDNLRGKLPAVCDEADSTGLDRCEFLSGALSSHDRFQFVYGYTEGRFKVSDAHGALSSFYLFHRYSGTGKNYHAPEIDIIEYLGVNPYGESDAFQTYHYGDTSTHVMRSSPTMSYAKPGGGTYADNNQWHTFGVLWEPQLVIWYIDRVEVKRLFGPQVSRQPMNIVNYLVAGSGWAPTPDKANTSQFPMRFEADYIRVYQRDGYKGTAKFGP